MAHGVSQLYFASFTSLSSVSSDIFLGRSFARVYIDIAGANNSVHFQVAARAAGSGNSPSTYSQLKYPVASGLSTPQTVTVGTAASGSYVEIPVGAFQFIKVINVGGAPDGAALKIIASDL